MTNNQDLHHNWKIFLTPKKAWAALYDDCAAAKKSIYFEQYIFENDETGQKFLKLFIQKLAQNVEITLICDWYGSYSLHNSKLIQEFRKKGGKFHFFNQMKMRHIFTPWLWFPRTHAKIMLIDSKIVYLGGIGIAKRMEFWRDTEIRFTGEIASEISYLLDKNNLHKIRELPQNNLRYIQNRAPTSLDIIYRNLIKAIAEAKNYIYITTVFLVPNDYFIKLLIKQKQAGVEIALLVPRYSEVKFADYMALTYVKKLLQAGIKVFFYDNNALLHSKIIIVDDVWACMGSANMDILSFFYNEEANVIITDLQLIQQLKEQFLNDLKNSKKFSDKILNEISWRKKLWGKIMLLFKIFFLRGRR